MILRSQTSGLTTLQILALMTFTSFAILASLDLLGVYRGSAKQVKELKEFEGLTYLFKSQFSGAWENQCMELLPNTGATNPNPTIWIGGYSSEIYDPTNTRADRWTPVDVGESFKEVPDPNPRIRLSRNGGIYAGGDQFVPVPAGRSPASNIYKMVLRVTDPVCSRHPTAYCSGTLYLTMTRPSRNLVKYFGIGNFGNQVSFQAPIANIVFRLTGAVDSGMMSRCMYRGDPDRPGGAIDYSACAYYSNPDYTNTQIQGGAAAICPQAYQALYIQPGSPPAALCCRARNPLNYQPPEWRSMCKHGEVVVGYCGGGSCNISSFPSGGNRNPRAASMRIKGSGPMLCSNLNAGVLNAFCRKMSYNPSNRNWCNAFEMLTGICPSGASCNETPGVTYSTLNPGEYQCCSTSWPPQ